MKNLSDSAHNTTLGRPPSTCLASVRTIATLSDMMMRLKTGLQKKTPRKM